MDRTTGRQWRHWRWWASVCGILMLSVPGTAPAQVAGGGGPGTGGEQSQRTTWSCCLVRGELYRVRVPGQGVLEGRWALVNAAYLWNVREWGPRLDVDEVTRRAVAARDAAEFDALWWQLSTGQGPAAPDLLCFTFDVGTGPMRPKLLAAGTADDIQLSSPIDADDDEDSDDDDEWFHDAIPPIPTRDDTGVITSGFYSRVPPEWTMEEIYLALDEVMASMDELQEWIDLYGTNPIWELLMDEHAHWFRLLIENVIATLHVENAILPPGPPELPGMPPDWQFIAGDYLQTWGTNLQAIGAQGTMQILEGTNSWLGYTDPAVIILTEGLVYYGGALGSFGDLLT